MISAASPAVAVSLGDACPATGPLLAVRNPGYDADGYLYMPAQTLAAGATVGLGSDGYLNDMFQVMRGAFQMRACHLNQWEELLAQRASESRRRGPECRKAALLLLA